ncbi:hypothetical protein L2E82_11551 [Cichorium intybus]|uniref:Uncharacterized protein n=1 Tax=Cichorium intybus TaxID=13427 RepID=A0ACB9GDM2_CICIN|nr:hypothetical protein L2E82_11551 [Cichorium intybus]
MYPVVIINNGGLKASTQCQALKIPVYVYSSIRVIVRCSAISSTTKRYNITLLPRDGIGPEIISVAKNILNIAGSIEGSTPLHREFLFCEVLAVELIMYKLDKNEKHLKPEMGLLRLREGLKVFANLRPASVLPQL